MSRPKAQPEAGLTIAIPKGALFDGRSARLRSAGIDVPKDAGRKLDERDSARYARLVRAAGGRTGVRRVRSGRLRDRRRRRIVGDRSVGLRAQRSRNSARAVWSSRRGAIDRYHEGQPLPTFLRIATKFEKFAEAYFAERDVPVQIIKLQRFGRAEPARRSRGSDRRSRRDREHAARARSGDRRRDRVLDRALRGQPGSLPHQIRRDRTAATECSSAARRHRSRARHDRSFDRPGDERALARALRRRLGCAARRSVRARRGDPRRRARARRCRRSSTLHATVRFPRQRALASCGTRSRRASTRAALVPEVVAAGLELARERIADFHERQQRRRSDRAITRR
jgi:hypothetical protein